MTDTNSLRTGARYALEVGLYATHKAMTEAANTIDTLRAENERLRATVESANGLEARGWAPAWRIEQLEAQLAETRRDAERWRWLKDHARIFRQSPDVSGNHYWMVQATTTLRGPTLDAAIDAAKDQL